jgi:metal-responsive CopG/Arc/MetJ family transcriptional regulator
MRSTTTISLPTKLQREVAKAAKRNQMTLSEYVRKAIQDKLWEDAFDETRRKLVPRAQAMGIYTDEDVFKRVS